MLLRIPAKALLFAALMLTFACVPNRKLIYLQDQESDQKVPPANAGKSLALQPYEHKLKTGDIVSIQVSSLTQEKYNIFNKAASPLAPIGGGEQSTISNSANTANTAGYIVDKDGNVELMAVGSVKIGGLTIKEAQEKLKKTLADYLKDPVVEIKLLNFTFTVLGEVGRQGTFSTINPRTNIMEALASAGGVTEIGDHSRVKIVRHEEGNAKVFYVDVLEDNLLRSENYYIHPNDVIVVAPLKARNVRQYASNTSLVLSTLLGIAGTIVFALSVSDRGN